MEEVLKGLKGKSLTKKKLFDFLSDINIEDLCSKNTTIEEPKVSIVEPKRAVVEEKKPSDIKCQACLKTFSVISSLKRHQENNKACMNWISLPEKAETIKLEKGIHLIIDDLLQKSISANGALECKFCKSKFINTGNLHKHFNSATTCNRLAYEEFKKMFNSL
jgi:hypothetical protein